MGNTSKSDTTIWLTHDYGRFKKLLGNRDVKGEKAIIESIKRVGYISDPILVNEDYEIIDGQNRLEAFKTLGMPVEFIIVPGLGIEECRSMNIGRSNWTTEDYIYSFAEIGNPDYRRLASLLMEFKKKIGLYGIMQMLKPTRLAEQNVPGWSAIKGGDYTLTQEEYEIGRKRIKYIIDLGYHDLCNDISAQQRSFYGAVSYVVQHRGINASEMIEKLRVGLIGTPRCSKVSDQLRFFDEAYNKGLRADKKVFLSTDFQKQLYMDDYCERRK